MCFLYLDKIHLTWYQEMNRLPKSISCDDGARFGFSPNTPFWTELVRTGAWRNLMIVNPLPLGTQWMLTICSVHRELQPYSSAAVPGGRLFNLSAGPSIPSKEPPVSWGAAVCKHPGILMSTITVTLNGQTHNMKILTSALLALAFCLHWTRSPLQVRDGSALERTVRFKLWI